MAIQPGDTFEVSLNGVSTEKVVERVSYGRSGRGIMVDLTFHDGTKASAMSDEIGVADD